MAQSFVTDENDLLFALENAESGNQLLDAIDAYLDGQVSVSYTHLRAHET